jgi:DNA-binding transcriptional regulator YiaG
MEWNKMDVMVFRRELGMNQRQFAEFIGTRVATISEWESGTKKPSPMACKLMTLLKEKREAEIAAEKGAKK